ncbi:MAG: argininosuccinate synthase [Bacteroidales bacterium]|jgi:argininosuccinate synthase|nr:argininosuccinate synthase [Bacteroidales bacterium]
MSKEKLVLAFSGGLDTSYCAKYLSEEKDFEVYSVIVNTGGFDAEEVQEIERKAYALGVRHHECIDVTDEYYAKCIKYMVFGNILKNDTYPLSVSSERVFQAIATVEYAKKIGAGYIAHGSTGAGNDQVRFDLIFQIMMPSVKVITPIREMKLSREVEIEYLKSKGIEDNWVKKTYSINKGLWGTSIGGRETLRSDTWLPNEAYPSQATRSGEEMLSIGFEKGELASVNGVAVTNPVSAIRQIEAIASAYAIGRDTHVGDTIIGIKGRVGFEAAAPLIIIKGHHLLEKHVLTKWQQYWKEQLANWYGMLLHEGQYLEPVMRNIEKFLEDSQLYVTGEVKIALRPRQFEVLGISSEHDLMNAKFAKYGEENTSFSGEDVIGFTKILSNQMKIYGAVNKEGFIC